MGEVGEGLGRGGRGKSTGGGARARGRPEKTNAPVKSEWGGLEIKHTSTPLRARADPDGAHTGAAGGAACGDLVRVSVRVDGDHVADAGLRRLGLRRRDRGRQRRRGARARPAAARRRARRAPPRSRAELGGLSPAKRHAAELAADALHRALGAAVRAQAAAARGRPAARWSR